MIDTINFTETLRNITTIPDEEIGKFLALLKTRNLNKGDFFIKKGEIPQSFAFVVRGLFRYYYTDKRGNVFTKGFFSESTFISSYSALIQKRESYFSIEALEKSKILVVNFEEWKLLLDNQICWHKFLLFLIEKGYCIKEAREREFLLFNAEERYKSFLKTYPGLEKRVKQHIIASFLGITPVALSRIRKKIKVLT
jgi:CRP-like cAMP-binding protein